MKVNDTFLCVLQHAGSLAHFFETSVNTWLNVAVRTRPVALDLQLLFSGDEFAAEALVLFLELPNSLLQMLNHLFQLHSLTQPLGAATNLFRPFFIINQPY